MKDYIVFFTEGFDKYNIDKQKKAYPKAFVSTINSAPDYNALKEEAKKAKNEGYDNFYMLWERNSVHSVTDDMKSEFIEFYETGALPYKYNKKLIESDIAGAVPNQGVQNTQADQSSQQIQPNVSNAQNINNTPNGQAQMPQQNQNQVYTEVGSMNVSYSSDHAASIFIWPINAYTNADSMKNALKQLNREFNKDNLGRSPENYKSTSTEYSTKKGNWATIIYVPVSLKELGQNFANSAAMINEIAQIYSNATVFPSSQGFINGNAMLAIEKEVFNKKEAKVTGGALDESSFLATIRKLQGSANKHNIAIFCTEPYKKYFSWCPKSVVVGDTSEPDVNANNLLKAAFDRIESYEKETIKSMDENPDNISSPYLTRFELNNAEIANKFNAIDRNCIDAFFAYYEWYLKYRSIDVYGNPNFNLKAKASENEGATEKFLKELDDFFKLGHMDDLKKIRDALGLKDKSFARLLGPYKKWQKAKEVAESGKNAWDSRCKINWDKISNKINSNKELTPEEKAEWDKIMAEFEASENANNQEANTNDQSANTENQVNNNTDASQTGQENEQDASQVNSDQKQQQTNKQNNVSNSKEQANKQEDADKKPEKNQVKGNNMGESSMLDLVDIFMKRFYESDQQLTPATSTVNNVSSAQNNNNPSDNSNGNNTGKDKRGQVNTDAQNAGPLSEKDKILLIRMYSLVKNSGYKGTLDLQQALSNFVGQRRGIKWDKINELLVAIEEAKKPQVRQEKLNELKKEQEKQENNSTTETAENVVVDSNKNTANEGIYTEQDAVQGR